MLVSRKKQRKFGIFLSYIQIFFHILSSLICTPIILDLLGDFEYGLYSLSSSFINYLSLLSLGFGASYIKFYSKYKSENDEYGIQKLNGLYMIVYLIMGLVAFILGLIFSFNSHILFNKNYSYENLQTAKILMLFCTFNMAISFPMSVYSSIISSQEAFIFQKSLSILSTIIGPITKIVVIFLGYGSIGMVIVTTILSTIFNFINILFCSTKLKAKFKFGKIDFKLLKEIAIFSIFIAINQIIDLINNQTDKIILGKVIDASAVTTYTLAMTIQNMYVSFSTAMSGIFTPKIHRIITSNEKDKDKKITDLFIETGRVQFFVLMLLLTGFMFFGKFFIGLWVGDGYDVVYYIVIMLMASIIVPLIQNIGIEVQRAKNKHQFRSIVYFIMAICNVIISIILCKKYGIIGTAVGTVISYLVCNGLVMNIYYHKKMCINIIKFWKSILQAALGMILPIIFGVFILLYINFESVLVFFIFIGCYSLLYFISIYFFGMNAEERSFIKNILVKSKQIFTRRKYKVNK